VFGLPRGSDTPSTQLKPEALERRIDGLVTAPIPDTQYSVRIWEGPLVDGLESKRIYNMDFVLSTTGEPVNSPFDFTLWNVAALEYPWACIALYPREVPSAEIIVKPTKEIPTREEKVFLEEGEAYAIHRPGKRDTLFVVPKRSVPPNGDVLNFHG